MLRNGIRPGARRLARPPAPAARDGGFSLVEVLIAAALFGIVLVSTGAVVIRSLTWTGQTSRGITATMVANQALESARALAAQVDGTGETPLVRGRSQAAVEALDVGDLDLDDTEPAWSANPSGSPTLPLTATRTVDGTPYTVRTVIGTCERTAAGEECVRPSGEAGATTLYRVIAAVTWPGCLPQQCPVTATTLVDAAKDPAFNALLDVMPLAVDKCFETTPGSTLRFDPTYKSYTLRDSGDLGNAPVRRVAGPDRGTLTQNTGSSTWTYVAENGQPYETQFTYYVVDRYQRVSNTATIMIRVGGMNSCPSVGSV